MNTQSKTLGIGTVAVFNLSRLSYKVVDISQGMITLDNITQSSCQLEVRQQDFDKHFTIVANPWLDYTGAL